MQTIEERARIFEAGLKRRNVLEVAAALLIAMMFTSYASWFHESFTRFSAGSVAVGCLLASYVILHFGRNKSLAPGPDLRERYRAELHRQARLVAWAPLWYVLPMVGPVAVFTVALDKEIYGARFPSAVLSANVGLVAAFGLAISILNVFWAQQIVRTAQSLEPPPSPPPASQPDAAGSGQPA